MAHYRRTTINSSSYTPSSFEKKDSPLSNIWENDSRLFSRPYTIRFFNRFHSLSVRSRKDKGEWTKDAVISKYPPEKTVELYDFPTEFETADLNQALEKYQHNKSSMGGYRIKWLSDNRALVVFRKAEILDTVVSGFENNRLLKCRPYVFADSDLVHFNADSNAKKLNYVSQDSSTGNSIQIDLEALKRRYRPDHSLELGDFDRPMETSDLMDLLSPYRQDGHIVRIKWFNKNRAIAWFSDSTLASKAFEHLSSLSSLKVKPYSFLPADVKYFTQDIRISPLDSIDSRNRASFGSSNDIGIIRRNTISGVPPSFSRRPRFSSLKNKKDYNV
ncbi:hypothetical protein BB560_002221 [Smittium megazygosporum]|uniref:Uncharacterized protein n=1 Tax=Smittium megazygosporum TaxID=133381 RepID=A0A2T9ZFE2_9FUNG|nr:hypothetical protein BB560_002221 [Smittium megazygosporum]